jgi:hypothetical protein
MTSLSTWAGVAIDGLRLLICIMAARSGWHWVTPGKRSGTASEEAQEFASAGIGGQPTLKSERRNVRWFHLTRS